MSNLKKLFDDISDSELKKAIEEIQQSETSLEAITADNSVFRKYCILSVEFNNGYIFHSVVESNFLKQSAFRWLDNQEKKRKE